MRTEIGLAVVLVAVVLAGGAQDRKHAAPAARPGVQTPGVQIPFASLKAEAEISVAPRWIAAGSTLLLPDSEDGTLQKLDPKTNQLAGAVGGLKDPCGGAVSAFGAIWTPSCGAQSLVRIDPKTFQVTASIPTGVGSALPALAATADSVWLLSSDKSTLSRVDPDQNSVVAELRLPAGCSSIAFGETALWATCPSDNRVLRIDPQTLLLDKYIDVAAGPESLAIGQNSVWVYCRKEGKVERIDPKTNKSAKTIETGVPGVDGQIAVGLGSVWITQPGFPLTRIDPQSDTVVQQFWGAGGGAIQIAANSLWLSNLHEKTLWRIDPKRVAATLAE